MILSASDIGDLQVCPRRFLLSRDFRPLRLRPKALMDACLRQAILDMSNGIPVDRARGDAVAQYLQSASNPGIDVLGNPYYIAKEWSVLLGVLVQALYVMGIPGKLHEPTPVNLADNIQWKFTAHADGAGDLHRYIIVDRWNQQRIDRELHSWTVAGDMAVAGRKLTLHVIEIGSVRDGHRQSIWVRGWRHPRMHALKIRFKKKEGDFKGWIPTRLMSMPYLDVAEWVQGIWQDGAGQELIHTLVVEAPIEGQRSAVLRDIRQEGDRASRCIQSQEWKSVPMFRGSCDDLIPCPYREVCYRNADPLTSGYYVPVEELVAVNSR